MYNDLYRFSCDKRKWTRITTPSGPAPRSAHQGAVYKGCLYVFGGEFTSPNQVRRQCIAANAWLAFMCRKKVQMRALSSIIL